MCRLKTTDKERRKRITQNETGLAPVLESLVSSLVIRPRDWTAGNEFLFLETDRQPSDHKLDGCRKKPI